LVADGGNGCILPEALGVGQEGFLKESGGVFFLKKARSRLGNARRVRRIISSEKMCGLGGESRALKQSAKGRPAYRRLFLRS